MFFAEFRWIDLQNNTAADCQLRRILPDDKTIAIGRGNRCFQTELHECRFAGIKPRLLGQQHSGHYFRSVHVQADTLIVFKGMGCAAEHLQKCVQ